MTDIRISEDQWDEDIQGSLLTWIYSDGAEVAQGEVIAEIMVEKLQVEVEAPASGVLRQSVAEGDLVSRGAVIGQVNPA